MTLHKINYQADSTGERFHASNKLVRALLGPVGSGKSVKCCLDVFGRAARQKPSPDGIRRSRWAVIRNTYPELKSTTIKTWLDWFPENIFGPMKWDSPITHKIKIKDIDLEVLFIALDSDADIKKLLSLEVTGIWLNEARELPKIVFDMCTQRIGRYPSMREGGASWYGVILDTNPPDDEHWFYKIFEEEKPKEFDIFKQPPGLLKVGNIYVTNPDADNLENLPEGYYIRQVPGKTEEWIKVYLLGEYGTVQDGKPVYSSYRDAFHLSAYPINYNPLLPIGFGFDFGLTPAVAIGQLTAKGQFVLIDELYTEDQAIRQFTENTVIPHLNANYPSWKKNFISFGDPAGNTKSQTDEKTCMQILSDLGIRTIPAFSNSHEKRKDGMNFFLNRMSDGEPAFAISPNCKRLRKGFLGEYKYARVRMIQGNEERYQEKPLKNQYSHVMEGAEYLAMEYAKLFITGVNSNDKSLASKIY